MLTMAQGTNDSILAAIEIIDPDPGNVVISCITVR